MSAWLFMMLLLLAQYDIDFWRDRLSMQRVRTWVTLMAAHFAGLAVVEWAEHSWQILFIAIDICAWAIISRRPSSTIQRDIGLISLAMAGVVLGTMFQPNYYAPAVNAILLALTWLQYLILAGWSINGNGTIARWYSHSVRHLPRDQTTRGAE